MHKGEIVAPQAATGRQVDLPEALIGIAPPASGTLVMQGEDLAGLPSAEIARRASASRAAGAGTLPGHERAPQPRARPAQATHRCGTHWADDDILAFFPRLAVRLDTAADRLSGGEQQMAAVARALVGDTKLLLLDEPFEGLSPAVTEELFDVFDRLRREVAILIVDHNLDLVLNLADRAYVLERGQVIHEGPSRPLAHDYDLRREILWL